MSNTSYDLRGKRVFVCGHRGMVGGALVRRLQREGCEIMTVGRDRVDLRNQSAVDGWFVANKPHAVFLAAGKVGGIMANNTLRAEFIYDNLMIASTVIHAAHVHAAEKLMFFGSSCIYPKLAPQPMDETMLLAGALEPTNEPYAIAKIAGIKLAESYRRQYGRDFISVMPTNLYGPGDNYHPEHSHVAAALIRRFHEAKAGKAASVVCWGTGSPKREFLHVDDLADASVHLMQCYSGEQIVNIGTGEDVTIKELALMIAATVGYQGDVAFDTTKPDGSPRKLLNVGKLNALGWKAKTGLHDGLARTYADFLTTKHREA